MNKSTALRSVLFSIAMISVFHGIALAQNSIQLGISTSGENLVVSAKPNANFNGMLTGFAVTVRWQSDYNVNLGTLSSTLGADKFVKSDNELVSTPYESQMFVLKDPIASLSWASGTEYPLFSIPISQFGAGPYTFELAPIGFKSDGEGDPFIAFQNDEVINITTPFYAPSTGFRPTYTISGIAGIGGASLAYTDTTAKTATADGSGNYLITVSYNWSGTVTPTLAGYTFTPTNRSFSNVKADQVGQNFTATLNHYTVTFNTNGGSAVSPITNVPFNTTITLPTEPTKTGHAFSGWYTDAELTMAFVATTPIINDLTLYAKWTPNVYTVTFESNGGSTVSQITAQYNTTITLPDAPTRTGYAFAGWFTDAGLTTVFVATTPITDNITLYAKWTPLTYTISGNAGIGGATLAYTDTTDKTATADGSGNYSFKVSYNWSNTVTPTLAGYTFDPVSRTYSNVQSDQITQNYTATSFVTVALKAFLAGPFVSGAMTTSLNAPGLMPLSSDGAYSTATYGYTASTVSSIPSASIVDWVLVELRTGTDAASKAARQAAFITSNGAIVGTDGTSPVVFTGVAHGAYYIVVRHRNHLAVMSSTAPTLNGPSVAYDFTNAVDKAYGTNSMKEVSTGVFGMYVGDINRDGKVKFTGTQNDEAGLISVVKLENLSAIVPGYNDADLNMDGNTKFTNGSNDNAVLMGTVGLDRLTRIITTQVPN